MERTLQNSVLPGVYLIFSALAILILPLRWAAGIALGILIHEGGHLLVLHFLGVPVWGIRSGFPGLRIHTGEMSPSQEFLAAAAGPVFSFSLIAAKPVFPELAVCGMIQGMYNLLPVYPSDGGRMIAALLWNCSLQRRSTILKRIAGFTEILILLGETLLIFLWQKRMVYILILSVILFWVRLRNIPCKDELKEVK